MTRIKFFLAIGALGAIVAVSFACGSSDDSGAGPKLTGTLKDFSISLDRSSVSAGEVLVTANNKGKEQHELVFVKSDLAADKLPVAADGKVEEDSLTSVDEISEFGPGKSESKTMDLPAGRYVLFCNLPKHYELGMHVVFNVN